MANQEHLDQLKRGIKAWNRWREQHPEVQPDLSQANLRGVNFKVNLSGADLHEADLSNADLGASSWGLTKLIGANLRGARLSGAKLHGANLSRAHLNGADLSGAILSAPSPPSPVPGSKTELIVANLDGVELNGANLSEAILCRANLTDADLSEADLSGADLTNTLLSGATLDGVRLSGARLDHTDLRGIPWLLVMGLTRQPGVIWQNVRYDRPGENEPASGKLPRYGSGLRVQVLDSREGKILHVVEIPAQGLTVGSSPDNGIVLPAPQVSRKHLRIFWEQSTIWVEDLGSNHGTLLDRFGRLPTRLMPQQSRPWRQGCVLKVGPYWLRLLEPGASQIHLKCTAETGTFARYEPFGDQRSIVVWRGDQMGRKGGIGPWSRRSVKVNGMDFLLLRFASYIWTTPTPVFRAKYLPRYRYPRATYPSHYLSESEVLFLHDAEVCIPRPPVTNTDIPAVPGGSFTDEELDQILAAITFA